MEKIIIWFGVFCCVTTFIAAWVLYWRHEDARMTMNTNWAMEHFITALIGAAWAIVMSLGIFVFAAALLGAST